MRADVWSSAGCHHCGRSGRPRVEIPFVTPTIRAAAVDPSGHLWTSFAEPVTYEFDADGDKIRAVQFRAAGLVSPNHMSFDAQGRMLVTPGLSVFPMR